MERELLCARERMRVWSKTDSLDGIINTTDGNGVFTPLNLPPVEIALNHINVAEAARHVRSEGGGEGIKGVGRRRKR